MVEMAEVLRRHGPEYLNRYKERMPSRHLQVMEAIARCRTEALGGHIFRCADCGVLDYRYHSCKDRHCPKCQHKESTKWMHKQQDLLLQTRYFLLTFTLPAELRPVARSHQRTVYDIMFRASSEALRALASDNRYLGGRIGMVGVLHTWSADLLFHPHLHYLVPGGALSEDGTTWLCARYEDWLVPVRALSKLYKAKLRARLTRTGLMKRVPRKAWKKKWIVHCKPVGTGETAIRYLAPYIYRVAISNRRIKKLHNGQVTFLAKSNGSLPHAVRTLSAMEFIRRFLQHVLPKGFQKVRSYGFLHPSKRHTLNDIQNLLDLLAPNQASHQELEEEASTAGSPETDSRTYCGKCGGLLIFLRRIDRQARSPPVIPVDPSP
jgi:hypothetical protein